MSGENKTPQDSSAGANESGDVQAFGTGTPITVGGDGSPSPASGTGTPITVGGDGSPQEQ